MFGFQIHLIKLFLNVWMRTEKLSSGGVLLRPGLTQPVPSRLFLVIEYVNGGDLMFHMQRQRKLPEEHAR